MSRCDEGGVWPYGRKMVLAQEEELVTLNMGHL